MYISSEGLQAIHQDAVNDGLRRSCRRRMLKEWEDRQQETDIPARARVPALTLSMFIQCVRGIVVRP